MTNRTEINICHDLNTMLGEAPIRLSLLAKFDHAVNYRSSQGMITILPRSRALQPYSVQLTDREEFDDSWGTTGLVLDSRGLFRENGDTVVSFGTVNTKDLNLRNSGQPGTADQRLPVIENRKRPKDHHREQYRRSTC